MQPCVSVSCSYQHRFVQKFNNFKIMNNATAFPLLSVSVLVFTVITLAVNSENVSNTTPMIASITTQNFDSTTTSLPLLDTLTCSGLVDGNMDMLTQAQFSDRLTDPCRYDRLIRPDDQDDPTRISVQIDIRHIEAVDQLQFKMHMLLQYRYVDTRLEYKAISPQRHLMVGEDLLRDKIWAPHIVLSNERESSVMGLAGKDIFVSINPSGEILLSYRMTAVLYCWMNLKKFPFDEQTCDIIFKSWTYNASSLLLEWDNEEPVKVASQLHLTEFRLAGFSTHTSIAPASLSRGAFIGNYSTLIFKFHIRREIGYYMMDYFVPSIMLVCTSWVTFWLQADNAAPRVTLGTSTMLTFITLASGQAKLLPKVSYIKASEIWFLGCTVFIFLSMVEFAFVNIIWRRKKKVELKKVNSKYIFKSTLTPKLARKELQRSNSNTLQKSHSCSSLVNDSEKHLGGNNGPAYNNYLTVHSFPSTLDMPRITTGNEEDSVSSPLSQESVSIPVPNKQNDPALTKKPWTTMTPQEVSQWIDRRSRVAFPVAFLIFNLFYWFYVYAL